MRVFRDIAYGSCDMQKLNLYLPESDTFDVVVWCHGGGLEYDSRLGAERFVHALTDKGVALVSGEYRMYPTARFPEYLIDAADAVAYVETHAREWGGSGELLVSGHSAGAWLTLMLCMDSHYLQDVGVDSHKIVGWISDSAQTTAHFNIQQYEHGEHKHAQRINEVAPQYYVGENTAFSRMLLIFYENDMPCRPEQNMLFYRSLLTFNPEADVEYKQLPGKHCHGSSKKDEDGEYAFFKTTVDWLRRKGI